MNARFLTAVVIAIATSLVGATAVQARPLAVRVFAGGGTYSMSDAHDAWEEMHGYTDPYSPELRRGPGHGTEYWVYVDYRGAAEWSLGAGVGLLADDFSVCWYVPSPYFPGTHCGPELRAQCTALELSATRVFGQEDSWVRPYVRLGAGCAWSDIEGEGEGFTFGGTALAPLLQVALGVDLTRPSFFDVTAEAGVRYLRFSTDGVELQGTPESGMDTVLSGYLAEGDIDFSGWFYRVGVTFRL